MLTLASPALAQEPTEAPTTYSPDRYPDESARSSVLYAGAAVALGGYGIAFGTSYLWSNAPTAQDLRLPIVGPYYALAGAKCGPDESGCSTLPVVIRSVFAALGGIGQIGGLALLVEGLFLPTSTSAESHASARISESTLYFTPTATDDGMGLLVGGTF